MHNFCSAILRCSVVHNLGIILQYSHHKYLPPNLRCLYRYQILPVTECVLIIRLLALSNYTNVPNELVIIL
jgi:hypothetical protein